jgi:hypothetical protein
MISMPSAKCPGMTEPSPVCARYKLLTHRSREFDLDQTRRFFCTNLLRKCCGAKCHLKRQAANAAARNAVETIKTVRR